MSNQTTKMTVLLWILTVVITLGSLAYQRMTGPTRPVRGSVEIGDEKVKYKLIRTHDTTGKAIIDIETRDSTIVGMLEWKRLNSNDRWTVQLSRRDSDNLTFFIPVQPAAGKVMYKITLMDFNGREYPLTDVPIIIRFKGPVPLYVLLPHIITMFLSMLLSTRCGFEALAKRQNTYRLAIWTAGLLFIGGLILGPIVQKFAFDAYWTGWPFGHDLTDNKTAVAFIAWLFAVLRGRDKIKGRKWFIAAAVVQLIIFVIPHSMFGSELDYSNM